MYFSVINCLRLENPPGPVNEELTQRHQSELQHCSADEVYSSNESHVSISNKNIPYNKQLITDVWNFLELYM